MPGVIHDPDAFLAQVLARLRADAAAQGSQQTNYIVDKSGVCQAIIGQIGFDQLGHATGLTGTGIAIWTGSRWVNIARNQDQDRGISAAVAFAASTTGSLIVNHALGVPPVSVQLTLSGSISFPLNQPVQVYAQNYTATQFSIFASTSVAATGSLFFNWVAYS